MHMNSNSIRHGSSKDVINLTGSTAITIQLGFTKRFSVFDVGPVPYLIDGMDVLRHAIAVKVFEVLRANSIPTHFIDANFEKSTITVEPFNIYEIGQRFGSASGRIIPLEIIDRQVLTQAVLDRAEANDELAEKIGNRLHGVFEVGMPFTEPLIECTTKFEAIDRRLLDDEAIALARLGKASYAELCGFVAHASSVLTSFFGQHGFKRMDGKWEIAITYEGPSFIIADTYSPDEMRLIGPDGRSYDKDPLRNWYKENFPEWIKALDAAKKACPDDKSKWPSYPEEVPPDAILEDLRDRYATVAKAIRAI